MRAISCNYHPFKQVMTRLSSLHSTGHPIDKINIRIIGGTWSYYPQQYQTWFVKELFHACNEFGLPTTNNQKPKTNTLEILQKQNEAARCRVVEISIETRQDHISIKEIKRLRELGVTKVELGVQSLYDDVLRLNRRGNTDQETVTATKLLRDAGFKVSYQMMPNLPGSDLNQDLQMFRDLFSNPSYKPDYLKIYPLALVKEAPLFSWSKRHNFIPYTETELTDLLCGIKQHVPRYCRIERVIRDIPAEMIVAGGAKVSNLRQIVLEKLKKTKQNCQCIRCREIRSDFPEDNQHKMFCETYEANGGMEHFLTIESPDRQTLYALLRLRIPPQDADLPYSSLKETALVREIHTYGRQLPVGVNDMHAAQHRGFGRLLLAQAEQIARNTPNIKRISVISGVGVRNYFRKFGFELSDTYMAKEL